jgi:hypothetical protein
VRWIFGDPKARVIRLQRRSTKRLVDVAAAFRSGGTTAGPPCTRCFARDTRIFPELDVRWIERRRFSKVEQEQLDFLADNPIYTSVL